MSRQRGGLAGARVEMLFPTDNYVLVRSDVVIEMKLSHINLRVWRISKPPIRSVADRKCRSSSTMWHSSTSVQMSGE
jgi:hypothetical protein